MFKKSLLSLAVASSLALTGCLDSGSSSKNAHPTPEFSNTPTEGRTWPVFKPLTGDLPIPNDLMFQQSIKKDGIKADGTYNDPETATPNPVEIALGYMDGASTVAPMDITFKGSIDPSSVSGEQIVGGNPNPKQNVFLLELSYPGGDPVRSASLYVRKDANIEDGISANELTPDPAQARTDDNGNLHTKSIEVPTFAAAIGADLVEFRAEVVSLDGVENNTLRISPLKPLKPETRYLVVVTNEIKDASGKPIIADPTYDNIRNSYRELKRYEDISNPSYLPIRDAAMGWESLAEGWFGNATNKVRTAMKQPPLSKSNIALSYTFTTGGTDTVLKSMAAPATFFKKSLETQAKQDAIYKLVTGTYNLNGVNDELTDSTDIAVNSTLKALLTTEKLGPETPNPLYNESIAGAIAQADANDVPLTYSTFASNAQATMVLQMAAAQAAIQVRTETNIKATAKGTVDLLSLGLTAFEQTLPAPQRRDIAFYYDAPASSLNPALTNPGTIHLGKIDLPYYLPKPTDSDAKALSGTWTADPYIGAAIDGAQDNEAGTTPPTDRVTYRYPFAQEQAAVSAPLLVHMPASVALAKKPKDGWPVVIYQHGIFGDRSHALPLANQLGAACLGNPAAQCFATVAIDLPLHGIAPKLATNDANPSLGLSADVGPLADAARNPAFDGKFNNLSERHFGWGKDGNQQPIRITYGENAAGSSGQHFINLSMLPASRDNGRQAVMDLLNLNASLKRLNELDLDGDGVENPDIDTKRVYFVGHSLGGIIGTTFVAVNNDPDVQSNGTAAIGNADEIGNTNLNKIQAAAIVTSGGGIARLLENSPQIGESILAGLGASGITQGSSNFEKFMTIAQGSVDSFDAINFGAKASATTPMYLNEIYGDGSDKGTQDDTIPVAADTRFAGDYTAPLGKALPAPLSGTEPLIKEIGAMQVSTDSMSAEAMDAVVRFTAGTHTTLVKPTNDTEKAVFADMATNIVSFFSSDGQALSFNNGLAVKTEEPTSENP